MELKATAAAFGFAIAVIGPISMALVPLAAYAESSKSNGNSASHGNSAESHGNSANAHLANSTSSGQANGALHSELKGLNAAKANPNALEHAAPNSQVGRIAAYRDAARVTIGAHTALAEAEAVLAGLQVPTRGIDAIDAKIAALDPNAAHYQARLAALQAERANAQAYADAVAAVDLATAQLQAADQTEQDALLAASGGRVLSDEAIAYVRAALNL